MQEKGENMFSKMHHIYYRLEDFSLHALHTFVGLLKSFQCMPTQENRTEAEYFKHTLNKN